MLRLLLGVLIGALLGWFARRYVEEQESGAGWPAPAEPAVPLSGTEPPGATEPVTEAPPVEGESPWAYCVRCRVKRPIADPQPTTTERGQSAIKGVCPVCGTTMFRFVRAG